MKRTFSREMIKAVERTIQAYERLIEDPGREIEKWSDYGDADSCRCCKACRYVEKWDSENCCSPCLLSDGTSTYCTKNESSRRMVSATSFLTPYDEKAIKSAARARLKWIIKTINKNGYEYK